MYITKIVLENVRCFKELEFEFETLGESLLIAGDNGDGKTALLRSIAMGLCDESSAAALFRELPGEFVRKHAQEDAKVHIHLKNERAAHYEIETTVKSLPAFERVTQKVYEHGNGERNELDEDSFPWEDIFVCGYGAARRPHGSADVEGYAAVDAVYTLFGYHEPLQNPELAVHRLVERARASGGGDPEKRDKRAEARRELLLDTLKRVLNLEAKDRVILTPTGIDIKGHWGRCQLSSVGDGYKATTTLVMDLLSWRMLSGKSLDPKKMSGIVLIDEIEQHLHPRWQLKVMELLQETFPKIQFIATTHSPLVVSGCKHCRVCTLSHGQYKVTNVYGWLAEDVYYEVMGLPTTRPQEVGDLMKEFEQLYPKKLTGRITESQRRRLKAVEGKLRIFHGRGSELPTSKLRNLRKYLKQARKDTEK